MRTVTLLCVFTSEVSQAFLRRFPWPQGRRSRGDRPTSADASARRPYQLVATRATIPAREICYRSDLGHAPFRVGGNSIPKIRFARAVTWQKMEDAVAIASDVSRDGRDK